MLDPLPGDIFRTGQVLNNTYEIEGILGRGGTGEVYRARNQVSDRVVALKALNREFSGNDDYLELMKREEEMRSILHPAVVRYSDNSRSDDGHVFLVMDFVDGPSLSDLMAQGPVDARDLLIVAHRVAEGLVATHAHGIVHRDLSPDNIILRDGEAGEAVIIDFGIAKDTAAGARTIVGNDFAGKYEYAAPEQLEGKAEARSDLYALGALLLAAFRGEVPFQGATPGEMIRRKQRPLDTEGVPEPLKGLIGWLAAPGREDRPADAAAVVARLGEILRLREKQESRTRRRGAAREKRQRRGAGPLVTLLLLVLLGGGFWASGLWRGFVEEPLPVADPYILRASSAGALTANAPDAETAALLAAAYAGASGQAAPEDAVALAQGMPTAVWAATVADMLGALAGLEEWELEVSGLTARLAGLAPDRGSRDGIRTALSDLAAAEGFGLSAEIAAGPRILEAAAVQRVLDAAASCGPLGQTGPPDQSYPLGATIAVTGNLTAAEDAAQLETLLEPVIGDRQLRVDASVLNEDLCRVRAVLPMADAGNISIWLGNGEDGAANLTGIYTTGENPLVEVHIPASVTTGSLWVLIVDNTGRAFHVLPNINRTNHDITQLGEVVGGVRRIRVLFSIDEFLADNSRLSMRITEGDFGKSEVVAILSERPLFDVRRPRDESTASIAQALAEVVARDSAGIRAIATRQIDARP